MKSIRSSLMHMPPVHWGFAELLKTIGLKRGKLRTEHNLRLRRQAVLPKIQVLQSAIFDVRSPV
jgi:hypothetical protein